MPFQGVMTATVLLSFVCTLLMGVYAKLPYAVAPGMGVNAFFYYSGDFVGPSVQRSSLYYGWPVARDFKNSLPYSGPVYLSFDATKSVSELVFFGQAILRHLADFFSQNRSAL